MDDNRSMEYPPSAATIDHSIGTRLSIMGNPLSLTQRKENSGFNLTKVVVYNFLRRPKGLLAISYHLIFALFIVAALTLSILSTVHDLQNAAQALIVIDLIILCLVTQEFFLRLWSSSCIYKYKGWRGKIRYLCATFRLIDLIVIAGSSMVVYASWARWTDQTDPSDHIYLLRFVQVFQALRLENRFKAWRIMGSVIWAQRDHLTICTYLSFLMLIIISFGVYYTERDMPGTKFTSIAASIWWSIVTLYTIGYGDMTPETTAGKILASCLILVGVSIFALPAGVLGTGLALKVQEEHRQKQFHKRILPAARIIQLVWRCYAASENSNSIATWKSCVITPELKPNNVCSDSSGFINGSEENDTSLKRKPQSIWYSLMDTISEHQLTINFGTNKSPQSMQPPPPPPSLTPAQKNAIRFIRKVSLLVAIKQFKNAFRPYDINDVLDQYSAGQAEVIDRVRLMQSQINTIQFNLTKTMKMVQSLHCNQSVQISRLESVIGELTDRVISLQLSNNNNNNGTKDRDEIVAGDSANTCPSYTDYFRRFVTDSMATTSLSRHHRNSS